MPIEIELPPDERIDAAFAVTVDDTHVLVGSRRGPYYLIDRDGNVEKRDDFGTDQHLGASRADNGELWLIDVAGKCVFARARPPGLGSVRHRLKIGG